jgi:DNA (cytosine-5)-methyltransferase 1
MASRPRLLDLFCGAGGAAMGYYRAGFDVVGVDIVNQKHYPFEFHQADALTYPLEGFDALHASPPCQGYSRMRHLPWLKDNDYPKLIDPTRLRLLSTGKPWVIENVMDSHLPAGWLCGTMFGMPFYRHRRFETSYFWMQPGHPTHRFVIRPGRYFGDSGDKANAREAFCWPWMTHMEQRQAIPPIYTEYIGKYLMQAVQDGK